MDGLAAVPLSEDVVYTVPDEVKALDLLPTPVWMADYSPSDTRFVWANSAGLKTWGKDSVEHFRENDIRGQTSAVKATQSHLHEKVQVKHETYRDRRTMYPGGKATTFDVLWRPIKIRERAGTTLQKPRTVCLVIATTVERNEEGHQQAIRSHEMLRHSPMVSMLFSSNGELVSQNLAARLHYQGQEESEPTHDFNLRTMLASCWGGSEVDKVLNDIVKMKPGDAPETFERKKTARGEAEVWHMIKVSSTLDPITGDEAILVTELDISTIKKLQRVNSEQGAAARHREEFFAAVSHELRTPLNAIIGLTESMVANPNVPPDLSRTMKVILSSGQRLNSFVSDILDAALIQRSDFSLRYESICLSDVVKYVCEVTRPLLQPGVRLINDSKVNISHINGDPSRISQVVMNLVCNSIKFTEQGSIRIYTEDLGDSVKLAVRDTGVGIKAEVIPDLFSAFRQGDMSNTRRYGGVGLGLMLVKELVDAHGGTIETTSKVKGPDRGTCIAITLPSHPQYLNPDAAGSTGGSELRAVSREGSKEDVSGASTLAVGAEGGRGSARRPEGGMQGGGHGRGGAAGGGASKIEGSGRLREGREREQGREWEGVEGRGEVQGWGQPVERAGRKKKGGSKNGAIWEEIQRATSNPDVHSHQEVFGQVHNRASPITPLVLVEIISVDDHAVNHQVIQSFLEPIGYKVTCCMDGKEVLDLLDERNYLPDLILLDVMMPGISGFEVLKTLREKYPTTALPVIMVSASASHQNVIEGLSLGANDYVVKPFNTEELTARISTQLKLKRLFRLETESAQSHKLLQDMLPEHVIAKLKRGDRTIVERHGEVTILFSDIVGFTTLASRVPIEGVIDVLNNMFSSFDSLCQKHNVYKVETIGDAYMAVAGHDGEPGNHAKRVVEMALDMIAASKNIPNPDPGSATQGIQIRIGVHSGPVCAGVVGRLMPRYCFFGDTVNTASRMESSGFPNTINVSSMTRQLLGNAYDYMSLGERPIKGKGLMMTYLIKQEGTDWQQALQKHRQRMNLPEEPPARSPVLPFGPRPPLLCTKRKRSERERRVPRPSASVGSVADARTQIAVPPPIRRTRTQSVSGPCDMRHGLVEIPIAGDTGQQSTKANASPLNGASGHPASSPRSDSTSGFHHYAASEPSPIDISTNDQVRELQALLEISQLELEIANRRLERLREDAEADKEGMYECLRVSTTRGDRLYEELKLSFEESCSTKQMNLQLQRDLTLTQLGAESM